MRRLRTLLLPCLILALVACGGAKPGAPGDQSGGQGGDRILAAVDGKIDPNVTPEPAHAEDLEGSVQGLVIDGVTYTPAQGGGLTISGTVVNQGASGAKIVRISVELLDAAGKRITRTSFYTPNLPQLAAGAQTPWEGRASFRPAEGQTLRLTVEGVVANSGN